MPLNLSHRLFSTAVALPLALLLFRNAITRMLLGVGIAARCAWEYHGLRGAGVALLLVHSCVSVLLVLAAVHGVVQLCAAVFGSGAAVLACFLVRHARRLPPSPAIMAEFGAEMFGVWYIGFLLAHAAFINWCDFGAHLLVYLLVVTFTAETAALLLGWAFGTHHPAVALSPNKTSVGYLGSLCVSAATSIAFGELMKRWFAHVRFPLRGVAELLLCGLLLGAGAAVGDLLESFIKRCYNVKDAGSIFPGWGGMLDRIDGVLLNIPLLYYLLLWWQPAEMLAGCPAQSRELLFTP